MLLAATVVGATALQVLWSIPGGGYLSPALYAAALLVFALGIRGAGSVTALRPLGTTALALLAIGTLVSQVSWGFVPVEAMTMEQLQLLGAGELMLRAAVAAIACVQIGRAGVLPRPWNWAPCWALIAVVVPSLLQLLAQAANPAIPDQALLTVLIGLDGLVRVAAAVFLGVVAILLARRPSPERTVSIIAPER